MRRVLLLGLIVVVLAVSVYLVVIARRGGDPSPSPDNVEVPRGIGKLPVPSEAENLDVIADPDATMPQRTRAIRALGEKLAPESVAKVVALLDDNNVHETVRNDLLGRLERQEKPLGNLGRLLIATWNAPDKHSSLWRNYCLQHMVPVWQLEPENRQAIFETLSKALETETGTMYETALLSLDKIGASHPAAAELARKQARERLAGSDKDPERAVAAMHVVASTGDKASLPEARRLAVDTKALARLRMASIAVLGAIGESSDVEILTQLTGAKDGRIKTAATQNLAELRKRLGQ